MFHNLTTIAYMLAMVGIAVLVNTILGAVIAKDKNEFDIKKLFKGILKSLIIMLCIFLFGFTLELLPQILLKVNIQLPEGLPTVLEIILTTLTAYKKYAIDCFEKFNTIMKGSDIK